MYCVICGIGLQDNNREGIVCHDCKQQRKEKRNSLEPPVCVQYCFQCGKPYYPNDTSIQHPCCFIEERKLRSSGSLLDRSEITQEAKKETYVLL